MPPAFAAKSATPPPRWEPMPQSAKTKITKTAMTAQRIHWRCLKFSRSALSILFSEDGRVRGATGASWGPKESRTIPQSQTAVKLAPSGLDQEGAPGVRHAIRIAVRVSRNERYAQEVPERPGIPARVVLRLHRDARSNSDRRGAARRRDRRRRLLLYEKGRIRGPRQAGDRPCRGHARRGKAGSCFGPERKGDAHGRRGAIARDEDHRGRGREEQRERRRHRRR